MEDKTILVPIDFSEQSMIALEQSYNLAKLAKLSISLLYVLKTSSSFWGIFSDTEKKDMEVKTEQKLRYTAKKVEEKVGVDVRTIIRKGNVTEEILRVADYLKPNLIVMGTSPGSQITRKIIGSRTLHIIKSSQYPVLSIKGKIHSEGCNNILLPIDITKTSQQKVGVTIALAKLFQSRITILTVLNKNNQEKIEEVNQKLEVIKHRIEGEKIECMTDFLFSDSDRSEMASSIINFAHQASADLIVLMTQQEKEIADFFLGSLAQNIIFSSDIPVLTIIPKNDITNGK